MYTAPVKLNKALAQNNKRKELHGQSSIQDFYQPEPQSGSEPVSKRPRPNPSPSLPQNFPPDALIVSSTTFDPRSVPNQSRLYAGLPKPLPEINDRASTFVAHAATFRSVDEAFAFRDWIREEVNGRRGGQGRADHEMVGWRVVGLKDGKGKGREVVGDDEDAWEVKKGYDDDGEKSGGLHIVRVLEREACLDVAVVVSRWWGGVFLGPVRFDHIESVTLSSILALRSAESERDNARMQAERAEEDDERLMREAEEVEELKRVLRGLDGEIEAFEVGRRGEKEGKREAVKEEGGDGIVGVGSSIQSLLGKENEADNGQQEPSKHLSTPPTSPSANPMNSTLPPPSTHPTSTSAPESDPPPANDNSVPTSETDQLPTDADADADTKAATTRMTAAAAKEKVPKKDPYSSISSLAAAQRLVNARRKKLDWLKSRSSDAIL